MNSRLTRHFGSLFVAAILTGCAMPPNGGNLASNANVQRTAGAKAPLLSASPAPLAYDSQLNSLPADGKNAASSPLANAEPITGGPNIADFEQQGRASWYGRAFHGRKTASGERFNMNALTAAHRTLPLASWVRVTNQVNNKSVVVKITDRGPYARGRIIDLSYAAAAVIGMRGAGTSPVKIEGLTPQEARIAREQLASNNPIN
jgi:rare lipoprotein A